MDSIIKNKEGQTKSYLLWIGIIVYNAGLLIWDHTMKIGVTVLALLVFGILLSGASILSSLALKKEYYKDYGKFTITVFILIFLWSFFMLFNSDTKYIFSLDSYIYPYKALPYMIIVMLWVKAGDYFYTYFKLSGTEIRDKKNALTFWSKRQFVLTETSRHFSDYFKIFIS